MNLLAGKLYDPAAAVSKATSALLALTALDTTNLRLAFVVPPSGIVRVRLSGVLHGATTFPQIVLGVLEGSTVRGRQAPILGGGNLAATTLMAAWAEFVVTGLTPGASLNWDAAYGVETVVAATGLKYGGPNNTTANDNFGGFVFEIWDPCPAYTPTSGTPPTTTLHTKIDTVDDFLDTEIAAILAAVDTEIANIQSRLPAALVGGRMDSSVGAMAADVMTAAAAAADLTTELQAGLSTLTQANVRTAVGLASANLDTQLGVIDDFLDTEVTDIRNRLPAALVGGRMDASVGAVAAAAITNAAFAVDAIDALSIKADAGTEIADALLDRASAVEGYTVRQLLRLVAAALVGKADGFPGPGTVHMRDVADTKNRITATVDAAGNRTAVVLDAT